jgi:Domain of Unknown Function (DUF928)
MFHFSHSFPINLLFLIVLLVEIRLITVQTLAENGFWYDAFSILAELRRDQPRMDSLSNKLSRFT